MWLMTCLTLDFCSANSLKTEEVQHLFLTLRKVKSFWVLMSSPNSMLIASFCLSVNFLLGVGGITEVDAWLDVCCGSGLGLGLAVDCLDAGGGEAIGSLRLSPFLCVSANCLDFAGGAVGADTEDLD